MPTGTNTIASCDQFKPISIGENFMMNFKSLIEHDRARVAL